MPEQDGQQKQQAPTYNPSKTQKERLKFFYDERDMMIRLRDDSYVQFNDRTLKEFIDDSEKRLNAYVLDKASQGNPQEDLFFLAWSNVGHGTVLSYEGFEKQKFTKKRITSYDMMTGDVEE